MRTLWLVPLPLIAFAQSPQQDYRCSGGSRVRASFESGQAMLQALGRTWQLPVSSDGSYRQGDLALRGDARSFSVEQRSKPVFEGCRPLKDNPAQPRESVRGTATYLARIAVPPNATLKVTVQDISRMDAPAVVLGQVEIPVTGVPAAFEVPYDGTRIDPRQRCAISASLIADGRLLFRTDTIVPVINGAPNTVELIMKPVQRSAPKQ